MPRNGRSWLGGNEPHHEVCRVGFETVIATRTRGDLNMSTDQDAAMMAGQQKKGHAQLRLCEFYKKQIERSLGVKSACRRLRTCLASTISVVECADGREQSKNTCKLTDN